jgi:NAD(P)H-dependent flavin oxidoreductase YrpB (nitropropane dioxygenase family)
MLKTIICELFGIDCPITSAGMGGVALAELAAAVSDAGGLGTIGAPRLRRPHAGATPAAGRLPQTGGGVRRTLRPTYTNARACAASTGSGERAGCSTGYSINWSVVKR